MNRQAKRQRHIEKGRERLTDRHRQTVIERGSERHIERMTDTQKNIVIRQEDFGGK